MNSSKISIIVPVFNVAKYLSQCLDSLINQTYKNIEIICVNDGSSDNSIDILNKYAMADNRITIINKVNEGISIARNIALEKVTGDYLMFVDSDDWIDLGTCEETLKVAEQEFADIVMWSYIREFSNKSLPKQIFNNDKIVFIGDQIKHKLHRRFIGLIDDELTHPDNADVLSPCWNKLYSLDLIKKNKNSFQDIRKIGTYEDGLFNLEVFANSNKVVYINKYYYHYRKYNQFSVTTRYKNELYNQWQHLFIIMIIYIERHNLSDTYKIALQNRIALSIVGLGLNIINSDASSLKKIKEIKKIISTEQYKAAYKQLTLKHFPIHWKLFYSCTKHNFATGIYILLCCIAKLIGR